MSAACKSTHCHDHTASTAVKALAHSKDILVMLHLHTVPAWGVNSYYSSAPLALVEYSSPSSSLNAPFKLKPALECSPCIAAGTAAAIGTGIAAGIGVGAAPAPTAPPPDQPAGCPSASRCQGHFPWWSYLVIAEAPALFTWRETPHSGSPVRDKDYAARV